MKLTTGILGCALATGLMIFAADKTQASDVIGGTLYSPLKIKATATYVDSKGKVAKMSISSKEVLKDLGFNNNVKLAVSRDTDDVWTINKNALDSNISTNGYLNVYLDYYTYGYSGKNNQTYIENGISEVVFYEDGFAGTTESANWFDISGVYTYTDNDGPVKNGDYNDSESYSAKQLSGDGYFSTIGDTVPVSGSASYKGSGKLPAL